MKDLLLNLKTSKSVFALIVHFFNYFPIKSLVKMILYHTHINRSSNNITKQHSRVAKPRNTIPLNDGSVIG